MARTYDEHVTPYHAPIAGRLLELAHVEEGDRILDIGCGTGIVAFAAADVVREMLERRRPAFVASDVARLIEARKVLASSEEGKETQSADSWVRLFRRAGLSSVETIEETHWATFRGPDEYLAYSFAWGDNERELRHMTAESRESFRREFRERVIPMITDEGLVVDWNLRYFLVRE